MSTPEANATAAAVELANANGVDLNDVEGTGTDGKITVDDVRAYIEDQGDEVQPVDQETIDQLRSDAESGEEEPPTGAKPSEEWGTAEDVDVADVPEKEYDGELPALILAGYWVKLGSDDNVPEEFWGAIASVVSSPWTNVPFASDTEETITGYRFDDEKDFLVKLRGSNEALIEVPAESIVESAQDRPTLLAYA